MLSDLDLARRIEWADAEAGEEFVRTRREMAPGSGATAEWILGGRALFSGPESPVNQALGAGLGGPVSAPEVARLEDFFLSRGVAAAVEVCPYADPGLLAALADRAFQPTELSNVLALALDAAHAAAADPADPDGTAISPAAPEEAGVWSDVVLRGFSEGEPAPPEVSDVLAASARARDARALLARRDGAVVGGALVQVEAGVALLSGHATLPEARGRGVQAALIRASLAVARDLGCDLAAAMTLPGSSSQRNFERHGFRVVYTRLKMVKAAPPGPG